MLNLQQHDYWRYLMPYVYTSYFINVICSMQDHFTSKGNGSGALIED